MRTLLKVASTYSPVAFLSTTVGAAQTGEFTATVPGEVVHRVHALQNEWQRLRNATPASRVGTLQQSKIATYGNAGSHKAVHQLGTLDRGSHEYC